MFRPQWFHSWQLRGGDEQSRRQFLNGAVTFAIGTVQLTILSSPGHEALAAETTQAAGAASPPAMRSWSTPRSASAPASAWSPAGSKTMSPRVPPDLARTLCPLQGWNRSRRQCSRNGSCRPSRSGFPRRSIVRTLSPSSAITAKILPAIKSVRFTQPSRLQKFHARRRQRCIGCAYCVQACPYGARFINPETGTADKCTWCYHRVKRDEQPACVEACPVGPGCSDASMIPPRRSASASARFRLMSSKSRWERIPRTATSDFLRRSSNV